MRISFHGDVSELHLGSGDRFEIREARPGFVRTIKRQDFADADSLTFDPGSSTELELVLGGRNRPVHSPFVALNATARRTSTRTLETPR